MTMSQAIKLLQMYDYNLIIEAIHLLQEKAKEESK
jgi:hypothetical protein